MERQYVIQGIDIQVLFFEVAWRVALAAACCIQLYFASALHQPGLANSSFICWGLTSHYELSWQCRLKTCRLEAPKETTQDMSNDIGDMSKDMSRH